VADAFIPVFICIASSSVTQILVFNLSVWEIVASSVAQYVAKKGVASATSSVEKYVAR